MDLKLRAITLTLITIFTLCFLGHEWGAGGSLPNHLTQEVIYPQLQRTAALFTDLKFRLRGTRQPTHKIVVVEIDSPSIDKFGRWPWPRTLIASLVDRAYELGAKAVGLDMVFSEPQSSVPEELDRELNQRGLSDLLRPYNYDAILGVALRTHADKLVTSWITEGPCRPKFSNPQDCPLTHPEAVASLPRRFEKFSLKLGKGEFELLKSPIVATPTLIGNIPLLNGIARHAGFANGFRDADGIIRRTSLVMFVNGQVHPSLPLELAATALEHPVRIGLSPEGTLVGLCFEGTGRCVNATPSGMLDLNFRGGERTFPYVSARHLLTEPSPGAERKIASDDGFSAEALKDAVVLIGASARALADIAATPFDREMPGVEVHANVVDNLLAGDHLTCGRLGQWIVFLVMTLGAYLFVEVIRRKEAYSSLSLLAISVGLFSLVDFRVFSGWNQNWTTAFLYMEYGLITLIILMAKYVNEEKNRKFLRGAFSKYVSPAIVDSLVKDPSKLSVGGRKEELTILFSDIRGFTNFSETMDAKLLGEFLIDYNTVMTDIIFSHGGTLDKYIGDAVMAFWGAPLKQSDHAARACRAAVEMVQALKDNKVRFESQYGVKVNIGIGLHSGTVSVGNMGSSRAFGYTVIGDHVNLASRLEGVTKFYGVQALTTRATFEGIKASDQLYPDHRVLGRVKVKGKTQGVEVIELLTQPMPGEFAELFEKGKQLALERKWDEAIQVFLTAHKKFTEIRGQEDGPCKAYIERCEVFKNDPPEEGWDGSWSLPKG